MNTYDIDLNPVLEGASNDELEIIAKKMDERWTSFLTSYSEYEKAKETGDYAKVNNLLANELREFGGNTIANVTRELVKGQYEGPPYKDIVYDVAKKLKVKPSKSMSCERIELLILEKAFEKMWEELSDEEKEELSQTVSVRGNVTYAAFTTALHTFIRRCGFMPYKLTAIITNAISKKVLGHGIRFATGATIMKVLAKMLSKTVNILLWTWLINDVASPAFRVTLPCILIVALSRQRQLAEARTVICSECGNECDKIEHQYCPKCGIKLGDK